MNRTLKLIPSFFAPIFFLFLSQNADAQFLQTIDATNNGPYTPQSLISNVFLGGGVDVTSIVFSGSSRAVGYFSGGTQSVGIERGILLTTGYAADPAFGYGPTDFGNFLASNSNGSNANDQNLDDLASEPLNDVAVYTITFIPTSDTLRFRYCFASEEYPEYSCTEFNDIFGFFIQGPGYPTPTNIARVPNSNLPVSINNVHPLNTQNNPMPNPCLPFNAQYYNSNNTNNTMKQPVYDGFTDVFTAVAVVVPCQPYTIKLAIADISDSAFDSGVFLEAKSFGTTSLRVTLNTPSADGSIAEGCTPASISFSLGTPLTQNYPINLNLFGNATPGADFQNLPANLMIPAGQTTVTYPIAAIEDGIVEALETIAFDVQIDACNRDTVYLSFRDNPIVPPMLQDTSLCTAGSPIQLNATIPIPTPTPPNFSNIQDVPIPDDYPAVTSSVTVAGVQPTMLGPGSIRSVCVNIAHAYDDDLDLFLISPGGQVLELSTDNGGSGDNYTNTCFTPTAPTSINFPGPQAPASATPFTGNFQPEGPWSDLWDTPNRPSNGVWSLQATDDFPSFVGSILDWSITFAPSYEVTYQWASSPDITCATCPITLITPQVSSTYSVTATDIYGCTATDVMQVQINTLAATASVVENVSCFGDNDGSATVNTNVGGANTYQWSDPAGQTTLNASNLAVGTYTVTVSNAGGCSASSTVSITEPPALALTVNAQDAACFGQPTGNATAQVVGGVTPYQYNWSNGLTIANPSALTSGTYTLTVTDANGCTEVGSIQVSQPIALQLNTAQVGNVSCYNGADGQITVSGAGGAQPLSFNWSSGQSTASATGLTAGSYTVTMTDGNGCSTTLQQNITQPVDLTAFATPKPVDCFGDNTGELHLDVTGGTPVYAAVWQGPSGFSATGTDLLNISAGNYTATVTDQKGCSKSLLATVTQPQAVALTLPAVSDTICYGASNGSATVVAAGGTAPFNYSWDIGGQNGPTATGLSTREYRVTVTDAKGCSETATTKVPQKQELNTFVQPVLPKCHDGADGSASVQSAFYGVTPANINNFSFLWNTTPVQTNVTAQYLRADQSYTVTISDQDGCTAQYSFTMGNPTPIEAQITGKGDVKCNGEASGWAAAAAFGGSSPYTWFWAGSATPTDSTGTGLSAGITRVTITDARGCEAVTTVTLSEPTLVQVALEAKDINCFGDQTGSAKAIASGGVPPYIYRWWNGRESSEIDGIGAGVFGMSVTDANGCTTPSLIEIRQPAEPLSSEIAIQEPRCFGDYNGRIIFTPTGGTPPYRYGLDNKPFNGSAIQIGLKAGFYEPKIIDNNGCITVLSPVEVTQKEQLSVDLGPDVRILLGQDTQLVAEVLNYQGNFDISWSPEDSVWLSCLDCLNPSVYSLQYNNYFEVFAIDSLGCRSTDQILVSVDKPRKVYVPTAFSPNGDLTNDLLLVHGQKSSKVLEFRIYDRWGEMVYEAKDFPFNDTNTGWDGTFRGQPLDPGVFVWVLEVEYVDGETEVYKGNTTLIR